MSSRTTIVKAIVALFNGINGVAPYESDLFELATDKLKFWDEVNDFPTTCVTAGVETREYLPGDFKWGYLNINTRIYVKGEDAQQQLESIFQDLEYILDNNNVLEYETGKFTEEIRILSISTDEGLMLPQGIGEFTFQVRYGVA